MSLQRIRKKVERGIFGIPKKKSVLFSFNPRRGEECLSDSEDSDYYPGRRSSDDQDEVASLRKAKQKVKRSSQPAIKRRKRGEPTTDAVESLTLANGSDILQCFPPEILMKIFQFGLQLESVVTFIPRVSRVCQSWRNVATDPILWSEIDLPVHILQLTQKSLVKLLRKNISCCRVLNLSGQCKLTENNIETALKALPSLSSLDLSDCSCVKSGLVIKIAQLCPQLRRLKLCYTADFNANVGVLAIESFLQSCGKNLLELRLVRMSSLKFGARQVFTAIEHNCPNLEILDLRITDTVKTITPGRKLNLEAASFFENLPKLSELRLDGFNMLLTRNVIDAMNEGKIQLKNLQIYSNGHQINENSDHHVFYRMFGSTTELQYLDISSSNLHPDRIVSELTSVQELIMNDMRWRDSEHTNIVDCVDMWKYSMKRLELSHNIFVDSALDMALLSYSSSDDDYPLQSLHLKATNVTALSLICVLMHCKNLKELDITSCRELPRGCKRLFVKSEFSSLIKNLKSTLDANSD